MLIAIVHYHLNRGGVTQVIASHLGALQQLAADDGPRRVVVLHGGRSVGWPERVPNTETLDYTVRVVPGLDYDDGPGCGPRELAERLRRALLESGGTPDSSLIHVHNHSLGKNAALPRALAELAEAGWPQLLQIHDFAEDFRPQNYQRLRAATPGRDAARGSATLYPQAGHVHYAVLNQRDARILTAAGAESARVHFLPNPVGDPGPLPPREPARGELSRRFGVPQERPLLLYPVRGIRRKNLGEALLWSAVAGGGWHLGITLAPLNPVERRSYDRWKTLAESLALPVAFETGGEAGLAYLDHLAAADRMLTTSVAEGFGLVFLEAWLAGRMLVGRDLPEITADFRASGVQLECLRPRLDVPLEWIGADAWRRDIEQRYEATLAQFGRALPPAAQFRRELDDLVVDGLVDFGALTGLHQQQVLGQVADSDLRRRRLRSLNAWLEEALQTDRACGLAVEENATAVRQAYSLAACGQRLAQLYRTVVASDRTARPPPLDGERILDQFLSLARFQPIRVEP